MIIVDEKQLIQKIEEKYWLDKARGAIMPSLVPSWCDAGNDIGTQHFLIKDEDMLREIEKISGGDAEAQYIILLAALELLVFKYLNQPEIVISAPVASSKNGTVASQFFFRNEIRPRMLVAELLDELAEQLLEGLDKVSTDLSYLKEKIRAVNEDEYRALERVVIVVNNDVGEAACINDDGLCFTISTDEKFIEIKIAHKLSKEAGQWITALGNHYGYVLKQILANPKSNIEDICILDENEKKEMVFGYNNTGFTYQENTVSQLFENQVIQTSDSAALVFNGKVFTYEKLNETVNQLADFLIEKYQAGENKVIAVMTERSEWSAIAMLAVIKTGACYLPLDLNLPAARTNYIIQNANPVVLLTELGSDEEYPGLEVSLPLEKLTGIPLGNYSTSNPVRRLSLDIPAFLIYTSGSTGKPKAVVQTHRTLTNLIIWDNEEVGFSRGSSILQYSSFAFDSSLHDIYYALSSGGTAHIVPEDMRLDYPAMANYITSEKIRIVSLPFTVMAGFFNAIDMHLLDGHSIQHIISTGEQLLIGARLEQFLAANPAIKLHNFYGPSETHVVTAFSVTGASIFSKRVPIGKPVYNSQIYILNDKQELVPPGMTGEIYIGGHNLALGYLNEPELTNEKFINNQFSYNEKIYKSGDLGRWLPGGILEYLGRIDHQVKIRGYRVELGEIEKSILKSQGISEALVTEHGEGEDKELIAYFVLKDGQQVPDIAASLSEMLPSYMIPACFIQLTEFPLTSNGKLDKKNLPAPVRNRQSYCAPATTEEIILARIWEETLGKTGIGIDDNFFELGGHSLKATRIISGIFKELKRKITLKNIFLFPTIRKLAAFMKTENEVQFYHIPELDLQDSYELSHSQKRIWVIDQFEENSLAYVLPMAFNIKGLLDPDAIVWAFEKMIARHESLRTVFINTDGEPRQVIKKPGELPASFSVINISNETNKEGFIEKYLKNETGTPFNLEKGPLLRGAVIKTGEDEHVLSFTIHHIISDGWSMEIFMKELMIFYNGRVHKTETVLPELRIHYKDFCGWQNKMLTDGSVDNDKNYWLKLFEHDVPVLDLPTDHSRMSNQVNAGGAVVDYFDKELVKKIKAFCHEHDISYFIFLAGIIKILLYRYTGQKDIVIGTPVAGRNHPDIEELIGVFINTLPVRTELTQDKVFTDFIKELRDIVTEAYHHQDYPFDKLVDDLNLQRDNTRNPLFDVLVRIDIFDGNSTDANILEIETINIGTGVSNFDLVFNFELADDELRLLIGYNSGLYKEDTIKRMAAHLGNIATAVTADAQSRLGFVPYLSQQDHSLLQQFNDTEADFTELTIDQLATRVAIEIPDNIVIRETERDITFSELRSDSNRIAGFLLASGTRNEEIVAVFADRGAGMIKLLLGILKANCAYLPIDTDLPEERVLFMLNNAGVSRILLNSEQPLSKYKLDDYQCTVITNAAADLSNYPDNDPVLEKKNSQLACIYYTSGSTGKPKGVMLNHAGLVNRIEWFWKNLKCTREDIYLFKTAYTFDVSMSEMFMPICFGCIMMITDDHSLVNPRLLTMAVEKYGITILHFSPTLLNAFLESVDEEDIARMHSARYVLSSGEALPKNLVQKYYRHMKAPIVNLYGPTEASIEVSWHTCSADDDVIPIGKPIANVGLHILDENNAQVAPGITGEICISGIALARGYLNNEMMTNERFVAAAINKEKIIVYRTGDRGKWNYNGDVEYLGRNDNQVSIGGYRIELGEIEQNLVEHPSVGNACVLTTTGKDGASSLSAYILLKPAASEIPEIAPVAANKEESVLIDDFNAQFISYETTLLLHQLFEDAVEKFPENTAVEFEGCRLSYHELNMQANRLAHGLRKRYDIAPEDRIIIMAPRSEKIIVALLAVLKAGAAYVPIDPDYPVERINGIIKDCGSKIVITNRQGFAGIQDDNISVIDIDELDITFATEKATNPDSINIPSHAAYLIYTSGTTGKPKGVVVEHRNICSIAAAWINEYRLTQFLPRTLQVASMAFDVFTGDVCRSLLTGGSLVLVQDDLRFDTDHLLQKIMEEGISFFESTPTLIIAMVKQMVNLGIRPPKLELLVIGSDALNVKDYLWVKAQMPAGCRVINSYGTTETTIDSCFFEGELSAEYVSQVMPIGKPMTNTRCYILNQALEQVGVGITGELFIGGSGVARGYINDASQSVARFIPSPFNKGERLYKTGDLAYWMKDGNIQFAGRSDFQAKIRGYRIEPGEVQAAMENCPGVEKALVMAIGKPGANTLIGYYVGENSMEKEELVATLAKSIPQYMIPAHFAKLDEFPLNKNGKVDRKALPKPLIAYQDYEFVAEIRAYLKSRLPDYMIPSKIIIMPEFPLTTSGKIDRKSLPSPNDIASEQSGNFVAPGNEIEKEMANIWQELLLIDRIGIKDNFFDLGGHSLIATKLASRIYKLYLIKMPLKILFNNPTIEGFSKEFEKLLEQRQGGAHNAASRIEITKIPTQDFYLLSHAQRRLWVLHQLEENASVYNMPAAFRLSGHVDINILQQSFDKIVDRYEILRTVFITRDGEPLQKVMQRSELDFRIKETDLSEMPDAESKVQSMISEEAGYVFNLGKESLLRCMLIRVSAGNYVFIFNMHHIISDGWSVKILVKEMMLLYRCFEQGLPDPLKPPHLQYRDYAYWQATQLNSPAFAVHKSYWEKKLGGKIPVLNLPADFKRPVTRSSKGDTASYSFPAIFSDKVKKLSKQEGMTVFMVLVAGLKSLLYRYSNQEDIILGMPIAGRLHAELEDQMGMYVNTLVLRSSINGSMNMLEVLQEVKAVMLSAFEHQQFPFDELVDSLGLDRNMGRSPLFDIMVDMVSVDNDETKLPFQLPFEIQSLGIPHHTSKFDIRFTFFNKPEGIEIASEFSTDLFTKERILVLYKHLENFMLAAAENLSAKIDSIVYISDAEQQHLLSNFVPGRKQEFSENTITELFSKTALKHAEATAVMDAYTSLSYSELDAMSDMIAANLVLGHEVVKGQHIILYCKRSVKMIAAMIGIMKAGAVYIPVDPDISSTQLASLTNGSAADIILIGESDRNINAGAVQKVELESLFIKKTQTEKIDTQSPCLEDVAYMTFTSGSTGNPKAVLISHRSLSHYVQQFITHFGINATDRMIQSASIAFNTAIEEIYPALLTGGMLFISEKGIAAADDLLDEIIRQRISIVSTVPSIVQYFNERGTGLETVRKLISCGDVLRRNQFNKFRKELDLYNTYGSTENTVCASYYKADRNHPTDHITVPIGRPVANARIYILNKALQLQPVGVRGEMYIGGIGIARGYWRLDELTKEHFIEDPYCPGALMHKTGDFASWLPDGNISFEGRVDSQVKIGGICVNPGEIENSLLQYPGIDNAVVRAEEIEGEYILTAYLVCGKQFKESGLMAYLEAGLPSYMLPRYFVEIEEIPLTTNGKVDYKKISEYNKSDKRKSGDEFTEPRNQEEKELLDIWREVLNNQKIGITDNFFQRGGHSLKGLQLISKLNSKTGSNLRLQDLFNYPTVEKLISRLHDLKKETGLLISFGKNSLRKQNIFLIPPVLGSASVFSPLAEVLEDKFNVYGFQYSGFGKDEHMDESIEAIAERFCKMTKKMGKHKKMILAGYSMGAMVAFEIAKKLEKEHITVSLYLIDREASGNDPLDPENPSGKIDMEAVGNEIGNELLNDPEIIGAFTRMYQNNLRLLANYKLGGLVEADISVFESAGNKTRTEMRNWSKMGKNDFYFYELTRGHYEVFDAANLEIIKSALEKEVTSLL